MQQNLILIALLLFILYRQLRPKLVKTEVKIFVILTLIGFFEGAGAPGLTIWQLVLIVVLTLISGGAFGVFRAMTLKLWVDEAGMLWRRGTYWTALLWLIGFGLHALLGVLVAHTDDFMLFYIGMTLGLQY